jgi:hypothetical protein
MSQSGGSILGEGVDGCVFAAPSWPCAASREVPQVPNPRDGSVVSKMVAKTDQEDIAIRTAMGILGPAMSQKYLAGLRGECAPANNTHNPPFPHQGAYQVSKSAVLAWTNDDKACGQLKKQILSRKGVHNTHKIMYIDRYPVNLFSWIGQQQQAKRPPKGVISQIRKAIPDFLVPLQKLVNHPVTPVYNIDLHNQNIFVRPSAPSGGQISFGIADFGHCLIGASAGQYLSTYIARYEFWAGYNQVPLEARILNFCFRKGFDTLPPDALVKAWALDKGNRIGENTRDPLILLLVPIVDAFLKMPVFLAMVRELQAISARLRTGNLTAMTAQQKVVVDFILSRYMIVSPINSIIESVLDFAPSVREELVAAGRSLLTPPTPPAETDVQTLGKFFVNLVRAPYAGVGSSTSLTSALTAVRDADVTLLLV